jgi:dihydrofolate synthase/folylpolyglutamate synthase
LIVVIGIMYLKDIRGILHEVAREADELVIVGVAHHRSSSPDDLAATVKQTGYQGHLASFPTVSDGLAFALNVATPADLVCVTGSLYLVASARELLLPTRDR